MQHDPNHTCPQDTEGLCDDCECHSPKTTELETATKRLSEWESNGRPSITLKDYMEKNGVKTTDSEDWEKVESKCDDQFFAATEGRNDIRRRVITGLLNETRTAARESALREALEVLPKNRRVFPPQFQGFIAHRNLDIEGWNACLEKARAAIERLLDT